MIKELKSLIHYVLLYLKCYHIILLMLFLIITL